MIRLCLHTLAPAQAAHRRSPDHRGRAGHTLVEILLALGLSLVILSAVYAALDQHWRYADAGQRQTERMQVTRALFERISLDLRSVVFRPSAAFDGATGLDDVTRVTAAWPGELGTAGSVGIIGDAESIVLRTRTPGVASSSGASQTVRWEMRGAKPSRRDRPQPTRSRTETAGATDRAATEQGVFGLARIARNRASLASLADVKTVSSDDLLAAEVETIRFRYFARGTWFDRWDSVGRQELPRAVEITIGFRRANATEQEASGQTSAAEYRLVVPVPAAEA